HSSRRRACVSPGTRRSSVSPRAASASNVFARRGGSWRNGASSIEGSLGRALGGGKRARVRLPVRSLAVPPARHHPDQLVLPELLAERDERVPPAAPPAGAP